MLCSAISVDQEGFFMPNASAARRGREATIATAHDSAVDERGQGGSRRRLIAAALFTPVAGRRVPTASARCFAPSEGRGRRRHCCRWNGDDARKRECRQCAPLMPSGRRTTAPLARYHPPPEWREADVPLDDPHQPPPNRAKLPALLFTPEQRSAVLPSPSCDSARTVGKQRGTPPVLVGLHLLPPSPWERTGRRKGGNPLLESRRSPHSACRRGRT